jgi:hypothetical protein
VLSLISTIFIGLQQINTSRMTQESEHFEKMIGRVASKDRAERLSGVTGLQLLLSGPDRSRDQEALHFLAKAMAIESDAILQNTILQSFSESATAHVAAITLSTALRKAVEDDQALTQELVKEANLRFYKAYRNQVRGYLTLPPLSDEAGQLDVVQLNAEIDQLKPDQIKTLKTLPAFAEHSPLFFLKEVE